MKKISVQNLTRCAVIAALYATISLVLLPLAFGVAQARISEALTLLPVLTPLAIPGVTIGCLITNAFGVASGMNILGAADIPIGAAATLAAALLTRALRRLTVRGLPIAAALPPVLINAIVIGAELTWTEANTLATPLLWLNLLQVGMGQFISCVLLGLPLIWMLKRVGLDHHLFGTEEKSDK